MSEAEAAICGRLKAFREQSQLSQSALAETLGLSRDQLATLEYARTPLRYEIAARLCERFDISQIWLALGAGPPNPSLPIAEDLKAEIPPNCLFSEVFARYIRPQIRPPLSDDFLRRMDRLKGVGMKFRFQPVGLPAEERWSWLLWQEVRAAITTVPEKQRPDFAQAILSAMDSFASKRGHKRVRAGLIRPKDWPRDRPLPMHNPSPPQNYSKLSVDASATAATVPDMGSHSGLWETLVSKIKAATAAPGAKASLARKLGTTRQAVHNWLSHASYPNAELTLELWDMYGPKEQTPTQKKTRQRANVARSKTKPQSSKTNENQKSGQQKP